MRASERGDSLIEVVVAVAVIAIVLGAVLRGTIAAAHRFGPDPVDEALRRHAARELRIAVDLLKYQGASIAPATIATTIPQPASSPLPAHVSIAISPLPLGAAVVTIAAQSDADPHEIVTLQSAVERPVPLPSSTVSSGLSVAAPIGAQ